MKGFNFEKNLSHQSQAVESTLAVFEGVELTSPTSIDRQHINSTFEYTTGNQYAKNIVSIQQQNGIEVDAKRNSNIVDIMMETGTGKTYTYAKTIFELNKHYGIFKFIVVIPTLSIKAGTIDFLKSNSSREHFKEQYGKTIHLHVVESQSNNRTKRSFMPPAVNSFVNAGSFEKNSIQVMIINAGMINSKTMQDSFDTGLFDKYTIPLEAIAATNSFMIVDEPHKFSQSNVTWRNIQKMAPQFIIRYGATFQEYENLVYTLTAVDSFNRNLVKGVIGHITEFKSGMNAVVRLISTDGKEARLELTENNNKSTVTLAAKESLKQVHPEMTDLFIERLNKTAVILSNGLMLKRGDKINPYSYAEKLQEIMIRKAIKEHFKLEREMLTREVKIKPISLFFIDNIEEYRDDDGYVREILEQYIKLEIENILKTEENEFYKAYLEQTLTNISLTHGGYFSKDNTGNDEAIEKEITEILHDKQAILSLKNPRRFIFSKWTLREGWDNPNVFQICKLRSSGSDISKLQEVGRGLRLPVNEYGNRVKDEQFYLNYFVDFTESDFVDSLVDEINEKSGAISIEETPEKLTSLMIDKICEIYETTEDELLEHLDENNVVTRTNSFKEGGFDFIRKEYPQIFEGVDSTKVRKATDIKKNVSVRTEKYQELKDLWEKLNEKVVLEYKFKDEKTFKKFFIEYLSGLKNLTPEGIHERISRIEIVDNRAVALEGESIYGRNVATLATMKYSDFLKELSNVLNINIKTLHNAILETSTDVNPYLSTTTIRHIKQSFNHYLMANAIDKFSIEYKRVSNTIHPTKFTNGKGEVLTEILASDVGVLYSEEDVADNYFLDELYFDSELEKLNIETKLQEVVVFTKIPKSSIKIPIAGGMSYSPDFAYVLRYKDNTKTLHFVVETKNLKGNKYLRQEEIHKIKHAEKFFEGKVKIEFKTQFNNDKVVDLIKEIVEKKHN